MTRPPLYQPGQEVMSLINGPGMTQEGVHCKIEKGYIYTVYDNIEHSDYWECWLVGLDAWDEKWFVPIPEKAEEAVRELLEEVLTRELCPS